MTVSQWKEQLNQAMEDAEKRGLRIFKFDGVQYVKSATTGRYHALSFRSN